MFNATQLQLAHNDNDTAPYNRSYTTFPRNSSKHKFTFDDPPMPHLPRPNPAPRRFRGTSPTLHRVLVEQLLSAEDFLIFKADRGKPKRSLGSVFTGEKEKHMKKQSEDGIFFLGGGRGESSCFIVVHVFPFVLFVRHILKCSFSNAPKQLKDDSAAQLPREFY